MATNEQESVPTESETGNGNIKDLKQKGKTKRIWLVLYCMIMNIFENYDLDQWKYLPYPIFSSFDAAVVKAFDI